MDNRGKILVIDDDPTITTLLVSTLGAQGYSVATAADGEEGLEKFKTFVPDIIILDIQMPRMDGYTFVLEFKKTGSLQLTPIIVVTVKPALREIFAIEGVNDYIVKPFRMEDLLRKISKRMAAKRKKILVVDDEGDMVSVIENRLRGNGYDVITAADGLEGLEKAKRDRPDLVVLDIMMPKLDGYRVCRMLKFDEKYRSISIILLTALSNKSSEVMGREVGADAYICKPFDGNVLLQKIKELLWD